MAHQTAAVTSTSTEWGTAPISLSETCDDFTSWSLRDAEEVDIAIIGAGPAGLAAAIGLIHHLPKDSGMKMRIYELATALRTSSQGMISLWPNGMAYLSKLHPDLPRRVSEAGCSFKESVFIKIHDQDNITTSTTKREPGSVLIRWHALQTALASMVPEGLIVMDHSLVAYNELEEENSVYLKFENGNVVRAKIVIGADGTFSTVRRIMHTAKDKPVYFGQMNWNAIIPTSDLPENARASPNGVKFISYEGNETARWNAFVNDCGGGHTFFQLRMTDSTKAIALSGSRGRGGLGLPGVKAALLPVVSVSDDVSNVLEALPESTIFERAIVGRLPISSWRSQGGRVALLGDAAHGQHPAMGQGANSALGSAVALVEGICSGYDKNQQSGWLVDGLENYERKRHPRMDWIQRAANLIGCRQSSSSVSALMDRVLVMTWSNWPHTEDDFPPPSEGQDIIQAFDPLSVAGVSLF